MSIGRWIALAAVAALVLSLAACGGGAKSGATKTPARTAIVLKITRTPTKASGTPGPTSSGDGSAGGGGTKSTPVPSPLPAATRISGTTTSYHVTFTVASDPGNLEPLMRHQPPPSRLSATIGDGQVSFGGTGGFIRVTGTIDGNGNFTAKGAGTINPYRNVEVTFTGTLTPEQLNGSYAIGTNGALPGGQPLTYSVTGAPLAPSTP